MSCLFRIAALLAVAEGLRTRERVASDSRPDKDGLGDGAYTFDAFIRDVGREYKAGTEDYAHRAAIFQQSLSQIRTQNARANRSWTAGAHPFMDWTATERAARLHGYKPSGVPSVPAPLETLQMRAQKIYGNSGESHVSAGPPIRNQAGATFGLCASCWAFAAVEAVEAQLKRPKSNWPNAMGEPQLSPQALLDCVQNLQHCGGNGGCGGSTPELAFGFMQSSGVALERDVPYKAVSTDKCEIEPYPKDWARVTISGWRALPTNRAQPLMQALVEDGPVVVAAQANGWHHYRGGIYDDCDKDATPNHSLLALGFGDEDGTKYWLLQNSWTNKWGEEGLMRLFRNGDEDSFCGVDSRPHEGSACDGQNQNITVCGSCGILFDSVVPQGARVHFADSGFATADLGAEATAKDNTNKAIRIAEASQVEEPAAAPPPDADDDQQARAADVAMSVDVAASTARSRQRHEVHGLVARRSDASVWLPDEISPDAPGPSEVARMFGAEATPTPVSSTAPPAEAEMAPGIPSESEADATTDRVLASQGITFSAPWPPSQVEAPGITTRLDGYVTPRPVQTTEKQPKLAGDGERFLADDGDFLSNYHAPRATSAMDAYLR